MEVVKRANRVLTVSSSSTRSGVNNFAFSWEVTKNASDQPFLDLSKDFTDFFKGLKTGKIKGARITKTADWWFVSLTVEREDEKPDKRTPAVGIDG
jgi:putative transposase